MSAENNKKLNKKSEKEQKCQKKTMSSNGIPAHFYSSGDISLNGQKKAAEHDGDLRLKSEKTVRHIEISPKFITERKDISRVEVQTPEDNAAPSVSGLSCGETEHKKKQKDNTGTVFKNPYMAVQSNFSAKNNALLASLKAENIKVSPDLHKNENRKTFFADMARYVIMAVLAVIMSVSAINIVLDVYAKSKAASLYNDIRDMFYSDEVLYLNPGYLSRDTGSVPEERLYSDEGDIYKAPELEVLDMHEKYERMLPNLEALKQINSSAFAWIKVEGTRVDYPVVRSPQGDNDYYLSHAIDRTYSNSGSVFIDYNNSTNLSNNRNTCVYGHNMNDGTMFQTIMNFRTRNQFQNGSIELYTVNGIYLYTPFSVYDAAPTESFFKTSFADDTEYEEFLKDIKSKSIFSSNISVGTKDKVVTLITCTNTVTDKRFVVHGVLTEIAK